MLLESLCFEHTAAFLCDLIADFQGIECTGPERKRLSVKDDKNEINFDPKDLLRQIASIYVHLSWKDRESSFAQAIVSDRRSYYPRMFADALQASHIPLVLPYPMSYYRILQKGIMHYIILQEGIMHLPCGALQTVKRWAKPSVFVRVENSILLHPSHIQEEEGDIYLSRRQQSEV